MHFILRMNSSFITSRPGLGDGDLPVNFPGPERLYDLCSQFITRNCKTDVMTLSVIAGRCV